MIDNLEKPTPVEAALGSNLNKGTVRLIGRHCAGNSRPDADLSAVASCARHSRGLPQYAAAPS